MNEFEISDRVPKELGDEPSGKTGALIGGAIALFLGGLGYSASGQELENIWPIWPVIALGAGVGWFWGTDKEKQYRMRKSQLVARLRSKKN